MAECTRCKAYTQLFENGVPICLDCTSEREAKRKPPGTENQIRTALKDELAAATGQAAQASETFLRVTAEIPSGLPHSDGTQQIHNASHKLTAACAEMMKAHTRLNHYLERGIVPDDLKRS
jgi:hypothetical protein